MQLFALLLLYKDTVEARLLKAAFELSSFSFFQRPGIKEFTIFTARTMAERTALDSRSTVKEGEYMAHIYVRKDRLTAFALASQDYPRRVAHSLLVKLSMEFETTCPSQRWHTGEPGTIVFEKIDQILKEYQSPEQADSIMKIQTDLDETKIALHSTVESLLERGETLDELVQRSSELSMQSKSFYRAAKKTNRCCSI